MYVDDSIHIETTDQCFTCEYFNKSVMCPLLEALAVGVVELCEEMTVQNCGFYKKFSRHLQVLKPDAPESDDQPDDSGSSSPEKRRRSRR